METAGELVEYITRKYLGRNPDNRSSTGGDNQGMVLYDADRKVTGVGDGAYEGDLLFELYFPPSLT